MSFELFLFYNYQYIHPAVKGKDFATRGRQTPTTAPGLYNSQSHGCNKAQFTAFSHISKGKKSFCSITCRRVSEVWLLLALLVFDMSQAVFEAHLHHSVHMRHSHGNRTHLPKLMGISWAGTAQVHVLIRGEERSWREREDMPALKEGSETGDKDGASSEALACFYQLNCNHTVWVSLAHWVTDAGVHANLTQ